jgi:hypothetical protein
MQTLWFLQLSRLQPFKSPELLSLEAQISASCLQSSSCPNLSSHFVFKLTLFNGHAVTELGGIGQGSSSVTFLLIF